MPLARREHELRLRRRAGPRSAAPPSTSRCSATGASTTRAGPRSPGTASRGWRRRCRRSTTTCGSCTAPDDWTQAHDLAAEQPEKLHELQTAVPARGDEVQRVATRRPALRTFQRGPGRPPNAGQGQFADPVRRDGPAHGELDRGDQEQVAFASLRRSSFPTAVPTASSSSQGGAFGGFSLYLKDGRPAYCYNLFGLEQFKVYGDDAGPAGEHQVRMEFAYDGGGPRQGRHDRPLRRRRAGRRGPGRRDRADAVLRRRDHRCRQRQRHAGQRRLRAEGQRLHRRVKWVQIDVDEAAEDLDHLDHARGAAADRNGASIAGHSSDSRRGQWSQGLSRCYLCFRAVGQGAATNRICVHPLRVPCAAARGGCCVRPISSPVNEPARKPTPCAPRRPAE